VYGSGGLFKKAWPKLLRAAAVEALAEKPKARPDPCPSAREVEVFLASASKTGPAPAGRAEPEEVAIMGRSGATSERLLQASGGNNDGQRGASQEAMQVDAFQTEGRAAQSGARMPTTGPGRGGRASGSNVNPAAGQQVLRQQLAVGNNAVVDNVQLANPVPAPGQQAAGNRLNVNRVDNPSALVIEARDAAKPSAVIHRSVIAK